MASRFATGHDAGFPQAAIFDVDGTLADTERDIHRVAFNRAFREAGLDWHWDVPTYGRLLKVTGGKERILHFMRNDVRCEMPGDAAELTRKLHARKTAFYLELLQQGGIALRPGVARLLQDLRSSGLRLAIATTTTPDNVAALLAATLGEEAQHWFDAIGAGDAVTKKKPAPDIYEFVLGKLGLPSSACFAFEDSANGLAAARSAGLRTIVTPTAYTMQEDFSGAFSILSDLGEPGRPCRHIGGARPGHCLIDAAQLFAWHAAIPSAPSR